MTQPGVYSVAKLIFNRRKCNTKLKLDQASSISPNDVQIVSALASALAMPATTPDSTRLNRTLQIKRHFWTAVLSDFDAESPYARLHLCKRSHEKDLSHDLSGANHGANGMSCPPPVSSHFSNGQLDVQRQRGRGLGRGVQTVTSTRTNAGHNQDVDSAALRFTKLQTMSGTTSRK